MATEIIVALIGCAGSAAGAFCGIIQSAFIDHKLILISQKLIAIFKNSIYQKGILLSLALVARGVECCCSKAWFSLSGISRW